MHAAYTSGLGARRLLTILTASVPTLLFFACGSRTSLPSPEEIAAQTPDGGATDARRDARDALSDSNLPGIDAATRDANRNDCPDAEVTLVYAITDQNELLSFNPPTGAFRRIGIIACPAPPGTNPFSMAVDRQGVAYVVFSQGGSSPGSLFRVSTKTAACVAVPFPTNQNGFLTFGMGFSSNQGGAAETLFVASGRESDFPNALGTVDLDTFKLSPIGAFQPELINAELTGTGDGRLFAFYQFDGVGGSFIGEVDKQTAKIIAEDPLPTVIQGDAWAFGFWGGDFYTFTSPQRLGSRSEVTRFNPVTKQTAVVGSYPQQIVGAGVSTCAPQ